jgi:hypothetical protein
MVDTIDLQAREKQTGRLQDFSNQTNARTAAFFTFV